MGNPKFTNAPKGIVEKAAMRHTLRNASFRLDATATDKLDHLPLTAADAPDFEPVETAEVIVEEKPVAKKKVVTKKKPYKK